MSNIQIAVDTNGEVSFIYSDSMAEFLKMGEARIKRASHVEPEPDGTWAADMSPVNGPKLEGFALRQEALDAEVAWLNTNILG